jgi:hypothetical protein
MPTTRLPPLCACDRHHVRFWFVSFAGDRLRALEAAVDPSADGDGDGGFGAVSPCGTKRSAE